MCNIRELIYNLRVQNLINAKKDTVGLVSALAQNEDGILDGLTEMYGDDAVSEMFSRINQALASEDWVLLADILETVYIPAVESVGHQDEYDTFRSGDYIIEPSSSGNRTIKSLMSNTYLHSNTDPVWEAHQLATDIYDPAFQGYIVWGCGLGYFADELSALTDGSVPLRVYDDDDDLLEIAREYGCLKQAELKNVRFICDPLAEAFTGDLKQHPDYGMMIHLPSVRKVRNEDIRNALLEFYNHIYEPTRHFSVQLKRNYYANSSLGIDYVDAIEDRIRGKRAVIVAAGPSLDDNLDYLRTCKNAEPTADNDTIIISVGTVLKKLLDRSVIPDYCVILDPKPETYKQVEGALDCAVPMILGMSSYWRIGQDYTGTKYLAITSGMTGVPDAYSHSRYSFDVGASVITLALEIVMQMGVSSVYLVGADMAYRDGLYRTGGTAFQIEKDNSELIPVKGVTGEPVYTTRTLNEFRIWIEKEISKYPHIPVHNLSKTGAYIAGTVQEEE